MIHREPTSELAACTHTPGCLSSLPGAEQGLSRCTHQPAQVPLYLPNQGPEQKARGGDTTLLLHTCLQVSPKENTWQGARCPRHPATPNCGREQLRGRGGGNARTESVSTQIVGKLTQELGRGASKYDLLKEESFYGESKF